MQFLSYSVKYSTRKNEDSFLKCLCLIIITASESLLSSVELLEFNNNLNSRQKKERKVNVNPGKLVFKTKGNSARCFFHCCLENISFIAIKRRNVFDMNLACVGEEVCRLGATVQVIIVRFFLLGWETRVAIRLHQSHLTIWGPTRNRCVYRQIRSYQI